MVEHCGGVKTGGDFVHTLTLIDLASGWTECVSMRMRNQMLVIEALDKVAASLLTQPNCSCASATVRWSGERGVKRGQDNTNLRTHFTVQALCNAPAFDGHCRSRKISVGENRLTFPQAEGVWPFSGSAADSGRPA
jgi:hypothetical protein